jgi:hypothetical protein
MLMIKDKGIREGKISEDEKMELELNITDIICKHNIQDDETRLKIRRLKTYALEKELYLRYALWTIVILVSIIIAMLRLIVKKIVRLLRNTR